MRACPSGCPAMPMPVSPCRCSKPLSITSTRARERTARRRRCRPRSPAPRARRPRRAGVRAGRRARRRRRNLRAGEMRHRLEAGFAHSCAHGAITSSTGLPGDPRSDRPACRPARRLAAPRYWRVFGRVASSE
jgi:hypothetical protein